MRLHVCAHVRVRCGKEALGGVWQKGFGHAGRAPSTGVYGCGHSTPGLSTVILMWDAVRGHVEDSCTCGDGVTEKAVPALWVGRITGRC